MEAQTLLRYYRRHGHSCSHHAGGHGSVRTFYAVQHPEEVHDCGRISQTGQQQKVGSESAFCFKLCVADSDRVDYCYCRDSNLFLSLLYFLTKAPVLFSSPLTRRILNTFILLSLPQFAIKINDQ